MTEPRITVIGAGLAGSEAAFQAAEAGVKVDLYEMRKVKKTPAHHTDKFAELVCTNSLRANNLTNAAGLLKEEMRHFDSVIIESADANQVPAGGALAVDRETFSEYITNKLTKHPNITVHHEEIIEIPQTGITVIATGPLTSEPLAKSIQEFTETEDLYFYDAAAPILEKSSIDMNKVYLKSRYDKGEAAYLNCPMSKEEFHAFRAALVNAEVAPLKSFEKEKFFDGCMPIEVMASRGEKTLTFGPLKPVGLEDPTGKRPYAVVQLRQDDAAASLYNMVGFQTHLKWGEQKRIIQMIPGLEKAEIVRYGVMHRNTFMNSPKLLKATYQSRENSDVFFAGQMTGVEGYVESAASGLIAGLNAARLAKGEELLVFPVETAMGGMAHYITHTSGSNFQPMNVNFGLFPELPQRIRDKKLRYEALSTRAIETLKTFATLVRPDLN